MGLGHSILQDAAVGSGQMLPAGPHMTCLCKYGVDRGLSQVLHLPTITTALHQNLEIHLHFGVSEP